MAIQWGIIGCGDVTEVKSGPGFQKGNDSRLVAVMRRNGDLARDYAKRHNVPRWYDDADKLIHDPDVTAVYIATPPGAHEALALRVASAGKPAYVEKPMARSAAECLRMIDAFDRANQKLFVAFYRRSLPRFIKARELLQSGAIGRLTSIAYRYADTRLQRIDPSRLEWRLNVEVSGAGIFLDLASHTLDVIDYITTPVKTVTGLAVNLASPYDAEDAVVMHWQNEDGALGIGSWNFASGVAEDLIELTGTQGRISLSCFGNEPVKLQKGKELQEFDLPNPPHVQQPLIQSIVDELLARGECPSTGRTALRTATVMDRVLDSYYGGRTDAFWTRPQTWPGRQR